MVAQTYQDLTSQVIKRTLDVVTQVERKLLDIVTACGAMPQPIDDSGKVGDASRLGSQGPTIVACAESASNQDEVDDLLYSLGF